MNAHAISSPHAPAAIGPYSQGIVCGEFLYTSGMLGADPERGALAQGAAAQMRQAMTNLGAVLAAAGADFSHVVKTTVFVQDLAYFQEINEVYAGFFTGACPARSCVQVAALPKGALLEVEAVAWLGKKAAQNG